LNAPLILDSGEFIAVDADNAKIALAAVLASLRRQLQELRDEVAYLKSRLSRMGCEVSDANHD
jgi:hypothetical protein